MQPLDLTVAPPRSPRQLLGGLVLLARTIDKIRATLPGGNLGVYKIDGMSGRMLDGFGIDLDDLTRRVAAAESDDDVVHWVLVRTTPEQREAFNMQEAAKTLDHRLEDPSFLERYPSARDLTRDATLFEMLEHDDREMFSV